LVYIQAEKKAEKAVEEVTTINKKLADGEEYFAVAHIFASNNDTFVVGERRICMLNCFILY
jgi:hypothetical protein